MATRTKPSWMRQPILCVLWLFSIILLSSGMVACGGPECTEDTNCPTGKVCKESTCQEGTKPECKEAKDCKTGETCEGGACKPSKAGCSKDDDCAKEGKKCDTSSKKCVACLQDTDCKANQACKENTCKDKEEQKECTKDTDCKGKSKEYCSDAGKCEWECKLDGECKIKFADGVCKEHKCMPKGFECNSHADCKNKPNKFCSTNHKCEWNCEKDDDCTSKEICKSNKCEPKPPGCDSNADCKPEEQCVTSTRKCVPKGAGPCKSDAQCQSDQTCWKAKCYKKCNPKNPQASGCSATEFCIATSPTAGACSQKCDLSKPNCKTGSFCRKLSTFAVCYPLPERKHGPQQKGAACSPVNPAQFCDADKDLVCYRGKCTPGCDVQKGTTSNPKCAKNEQCQAETLYSHLGGICFAVPTQKEGDACDNLAKRCLTGFTCYFGRCRKACTGPTDCASNQWCYARRVCANKCDPAKGLVINPACPDFTYCRADSRSYKPGYCQGLISQGTGPKKLGEACFITPGNLCDRSKGIFCDIKTRRCVRACNPKKGTKTNPACGSDACQESTTSPTGGLCQAAGSQKENEPCDGSKQICGKGLSCYQGYCKKECDLRNPTSCGSQSICYPNGVKGACLVKCDPQKAVLNNTNCKSYEFCQSGTRTFAPGYCRPKPKKTQGPKKFGEKCNDLLPGQACDAKSGLYCSSNLTCQKVCDPTKGTKTNAACDKDQQCALDVFRSHLGGGCISLCNPAQGSTLNKACKAGTYCKLDTRTFKPGYCAKLSPKQKGTRKLGENCSNFNPALACDGSKDLFCNINKCAKACDPRKGISGNSLCGSNEDCNESGNYSHLGGVCVPKATQKENELCDASKRCLTGLVCYNYSSAQKVALCQKKCDPAKPSCPTGSTCKPMGPAVHVCVANIELKQKKGDACLSGDPRKTSYHDCAKGLGCNKNKCVDGKKLYSACGGTTGDVCSSELVCLGSRTLKRYYCLNSCDPAAPKCSTGFKCIRINGSRHPGSCAQTCTADSDCKTYGKSCVSVGSQGKICQ